MSNSTPEIYLHTSPPERPRNPNLIFLRATLQATSKHRTNHPSPSSPKTKSSEIPGSPIPCFLQPLCSGAWLSLCSGCKLNPKRHGLSPMRNKIFTRDPGTPVIRQHQTIERYTNTLYTTCQSNQIKLSLVMTRDGLQSSRVYILATMRRRALCSEWIWSEEIRR
jgi:hypothetical protein